MIPKQFRFIFIICILAFAISDYISHSYILGTVELFLTIFLSTAYIYMHTKAEKENGSN